MGVKGKPQPRLRGDGYRGVMRRVYPSGEVGYRARLWDGTHSVFSKTFKNAREAAKAYDEMAFEKWGREAILNFPRARP